ncbi:MAG: leucine-rich repeat protein [Bacilli bacterium]|nr:leucine-rich repeat protein [Bacilli bacterium]
MKKKIIVVVFFIIIAIFGMIYINKNKNTTTIDLINISKLSDKFMNNYFSEIKSLTTKEQNNALIVISKKEIKKGYGAKKIIPSPNNQYILIYNNTKNRDKAVSKLKEDKNVLSVELNNLYEISNDNTTSGNYNSWGIEKMGLDKAISQLNNLNTEDVNVAIVDSGCDMELFNKYFNGRIVETYNVYDGNNTMYDSHGHGTHIAGTIAEGTPNNVKIIPVKQGDTGFYTSINNMAAINWIVYNNKADVINMSYATPIRSEAEYQVLEAAKLRNIIPVAAAGNYNKSAPHYPAALDNTISVASVDSNFNKKQDSNYGKAISFAAPGASIKSIMSSSSQISQDFINMGIDDHDDDFETIGGTSMATPHVVSAVAILKSMNKSLTFNQVMNLLEKHSIDIGDEGWDQYFGYGFINFSGATFCDGNDCDQYNVFKNESSSIVKKIDLGEDTYESLYNFGNESNILNMEVKIYYSDTEYITKELGSLDNYSIDGYNPNVEGIQNITINYKGTSASKKVNNHLTEGWEYVDIDSNTIEIEGIVPTENYPKYITVPETYKGYRVGSIWGNTFTEKKDLKKVEILAKIKEIGAHMFYNCENLKSVILPDSLEIIDDSAFYNTASLLALELPEGLKNINTNAFLNSGLDNIRIPGTVKSIEEGAFEHSLNLTSVIFEDGVEEIASNAFKDDSNLYSIVIPKSVNNIEYGAFANNIALTDITIDTNNLVYESLAGSGTIVKSDIKELIYANSDSTISSDVKIVGPYALNTDNHKSIILPENIKEIKNKALYYCDYVVLPRSIDTIESTDAFSRANLWGTMNFVYENSFVHNYLSTNNIAFCIIDSETANITAYKTNFKAFETVEINDLNVVDRFEGTEPFEESMQVSLTGERFYWVYYQNGGNYFKNGDEYYTVEFDGPFTKKHFSEKIYVTVTKATPKYNVPTGITASSGQRLSEVSLPNGFEWMNGNQIINELGNVTYKAKFIPEDTNNYEIVENINITITVGDSKAIINPNITVANKVYDGTTNISSSKINISNLLSSEYTVVSAVSSNATVGQRTATITLRLSDSKYLTHSFEGGVQEKEFIVNFEILKANINLNDQSKDVHVIYDGEEHSIDFNLECDSNANIRFMDSNNEYTLTEIPKYTEMGIYTTKYKVYIDDNYNEYYGQKTLMIEDTISYVIDDYDVDETNKYISKVMVNTELDTFTSNITLGVGYAVNIDYKEMDNKKLIYTGGKTKITKYSSLYREFTNVVIGDINGDGIVDDLDLSKVKNHLMRTDLLKDAYLISSDINYDTKTNSADLLRMKLHLLGKKPIG